MAYQPLSDFIKQDADKSSDAIRNFPGNKSEYRLKMLTENISFGNVTVNTLSVNQALVIANIGFADVELDDIIICGDFIISGTEPILIKSGEITSINIVFQPKRTGVHTGGVYFNADKAEGMHFVLLNGNGT